MWARTSFTGNKEDYRHFADAVLKHALKRGYTPRIWGSLSTKPGKNPRGEQGRSNEPLEYRMDEGLGGREPGL